MDTIELNNASGTSIVRLRGGSKMRISRTSSGALIIENEEYSCMEACGRYTYMIAVIYVVGVIVFFATSNKEVLAHFIQKITTDLDNFRQSFA